jgi:hypothetical protein
MENDFWESEELSSEEVAQETQEPSQDEVAEAMYEAVQSQEEIEEEDDSELLTNARLRLEQGKLYEMLLKHDLFGSVDAEPKAVQNVQREIRNFIKERLEVLLGLRQDPRIRTSPAEMPGQFTSLEVDLLKRFLAKMSKGATEQIQEDVVPVRASVKKEGIRPLSSGPSPRSQAIRPVAAKVRPPVAAPVKPKTQAAPQSQIKTSNPEIKRILEEEFGENEMPLGGPAGKVRRSELMERNRRIAQRQAMRTATNPNKIPTPNGDQEAMMMMQHVMSRNESLQQTGGKTLNIAIARALQK